MKKLSIIVPYRNRTAHLRQFIPHIKSKLKDAEILVIEQEEGKPFNRAKLLNIGFLESKADYFAFHDVDMIPTKADYSYCDNPTHIATRCSQFRYKMPFPEYFGGVTLFNKEDFIKCNGYSNDFWSWGAEDNEMYDNVIKSGLIITRRQCTFESLYHRLEDRSQHSLNIKKWKKGRNENDGLSHCEYKVLSRDERNGYSLILVSL